MNGRIELDREPDITSERGSNMPVELVISVPGLMPKGSFDGDGVKMEVDFDNQATVRALSDAMTRIPSKLHEAFFTGERKGLIYLGLGAATLLVGLAAWEFKDRKGEDILYFGAKLREAREKFFDK